MSAEDLGKKLHAEVEEVGLDEVCFDYDVKGSNTHQTKILNTLRHNDDDHTIAHFGIPALDTMLHCMADVRASSTKLPPTLPVLELMSLVPGGGKTHLLYYLTAIAVLPKPHGGRQSSVVIIDTDGWFSVPRLAEQMKSLLSQHAAHTSDAPPSSPSTRDEILHSALRHVHIFHPHSLESTTATLRSLPTYLFNPTAHHSFDRAIAFIALDSASAFYWQFRADAEDAALPSDTSISPTKSKAYAHPSQAYANLAAALKHASKVLNTPIIYTTRHLGLLKDPASYGPSSRSFRPPLPAPWPSFSTLRLVVHRAAVRKLPVQMSVEEARREAEARQKVVDDGKFECFVDEFGVEETVLQRLRVGGAGFDFRIMGDGVSLRSNVMSPEEAEPS
jgi:DNA-repair protein XRCC2